MGIEDRGSRLAAGRWIACPPTIAPPSFQEASKTVSSVLQIFRDRRQGKLPSDEKAASWIVILLTAVGFVELEQRLEKEEGLEGYVEDKIR